jgi:hypothetical protein
MLPLAASIWTTAVVPLAAAVAGGTLVALFNARTQRDQHLREQMLRAADEFCVAYADAALALRDAITRNMTRRMQAAEKGMPKVRALLPRVELLFHPNSHTAREAGEATGHLVRAHYSVTLAMNRDNEDDPIDPSIFSELREAEDALDPVTRAAWTALRRPRRRWRKPATTRSQRLKYLDAQYDVLTRGNAAKANAREKDGHANGNEETRSSTPRGS